MVEEEKLRLRAAGIFCFVALLGGQLLFSSPEIREKIWFGGFLVLGLAGPTRLWRGMSCWEVLGLTFAFGGLLLGTLMNEESGWGDYGRILAGLFGVLALRGLVIWLRADEKARRGVFVVGGSWLLILLGVSLLAYLAQIEVVLFGDDWPPYFDRFRIALIWPGRILTGFWGQIAWENTVYAGMYFAGGFVLLWEWGLREKGARRLTWMGVLCLLVAAVYLTDSRTAWLIFGVGSVVSLLGRGLGDWGRWLGVFFLGLVMGWGFLELKGELSGVESSHHGGLLERGSAGRLDGYRELAEGVGNFWIGDGQAAVGQAVGALLHEHSTLMASFRGGGILSCLGLGWLLGLAAWRAFVAWLVSGRREALLLLAVVGGAFLFDRSGVLGFSSFIEYPAVWTAVWVGLGSGRCGKVSVFKRAKTA